MLPIILAKHPSTLLDQARWLYQEVPERTAVVFIDSENNEKRVTYAEFFEEAARYAHAMSEAGIKPGDLVAIILDHDEAVLYSFWGAMLLGVVPSIFPFLTDKLDRNKYFDSVQQLINHEDIRVVITYTGLEGELRECLADIDTLAGIINKDSLETGGDVNHYLSMNPATAEDTAFLQHSSGSTGLQKGVMLSHQSVLNQVASYSEKIKLRPDDVVASWLPLYHDMGLIAGFIMPILQGIKLVLMSPHHWVRDPKILLHAIQRHQGTLCWLPNFAYNFLATRIRDRDIENLDLSSVRSFINCSEPVHHESHLLFTKKYEPYGLAEDALSTCYAMAENTFAVTQSPIHQPIKIDIVERKTIMDDKKAVPATIGHSTQIFVSCGTPIANCEVQIMDTDHHKLPERHVGEIALKSDSMLSGYYKRPDLSADALKGEWYYTGDMGYMVDGELYITGRKKDLIIVGGKNVYPQDIENLLNDLQGIHAGRTTAFGVYNEKLGTEDIAIVAEVSNGINPENRDETTPIMKEIRARVAQNTDVTARFVHLVGPKWLLKTSSGKIARSSNREKFLQEVLKQ